MIRHCGKAVDQAAFLSVNESRLLGLHAMNALSAIKSNNTKIEHTHFEHKAIK